VSFAEDVEPDFNIPSYNGICCPLVECLTLQLIVIIIDLFQSY